MHRLLATFLISLGLIAPAYGADIPAKAPPAAATVASPWQGIYFGALVGGAKTSDAFAFPALLVPGTGDVHPTGLLAGGLVGFGGFYGPTLIAVEADASYDFTKSNTTCLLVLNCEAKGSWLLTQRLVVGAPLGAITGSAPRPAPPPPPARAAARHPPPRP